MKNYYVYILTTRKNTALYIGISSDLARRVYERKNDLISGHTKKYSIHKLVYFEMYNDPENAIKREKELKGWRREKKISLIEKDNPAYRDLYDDLF